MHDKQFSVLTRRDFIRRAACAAVGTAAMTSAISDLRFMNAAVAQSNITDYKALVCIFLQGGNDSNNLILPTLQSEYNNYASIRTPILAHSAKRHPAGEFAGQRRQHIWFASQLPRIADVVRRGQAGVFVQHRHAGLSRSPARNISPEPTSRRSFFPMPTRRRNGKPPFPTSRRPPAGAGAARIC